MPTSPYTCGVLCVSGMCRSPSLLTPPHLVGRDVVKPLDRANMVGALQQLMRADEVVPAELQRIAKAEIDVRLRGEMHNHVDLELAQAAQDILPLRHVAVEEGEVRPALEHAGVVARAAVVQLVEGDDVVGARILCGEVSDDPGGTAEVSGNLLIGLIVGLT